MIPGSPNGATHLKGFLFVLPAFGLPEDVDARSMRAVRGDGLGRRAKRAVAQARASIQVL